MANFNIKSYIPSIITFIRIILSPILFLTIVNNFSIYSIIIFLFAILTDVVDGYVSRRWNVSSSRGAYFDVTADFILVLAGFTALVIKNIYPSWILIIIIFMFLQFIITSRSRIPTYDPVGKYYGAFLFLALFIGLIINITIINTFLTIIIVIFTIISIISRFIYFLKHRN